MKNILLVLFFTAISFYTSPAFALQAGGKAVPLKISKWLKNGPVPLNIGKKVPENKSKDLFVLELWGTWSPACRESVPMLVYLQNKYRDKGLQIIAVSREKRETVEEFLDEYPRINYAVAVDDQSLTTLSYLGESRLLPRLYIIDAKGDILWDGEVADLAMILEKIYKGTYNVAIQKEVSHLQQELEVSLRSGSFAETVKLSDQILKLDPENGLAVRMRMFMYENQRQVEKAWDFINSRIKTTPDNTMLYFVKMDIISRFPQYTKYASVLAEDVQKRFRDNAQMLNNMAWGLLTRFPFDGRVLRPAAACTQRALKLAAADKKNPDFYASCLNTMALVYYRCGMVAKALETQREVSKLIKADKARPSSDQAEKLYESALNMAKELSAVKK